MAPGHVPCLYDASPAAEEAGSPPASPPILILPSDAVHNVFGRLSFRQALDCRLVCSLFSNVISYPTILAGFPGLLLVALCYPGADASSPFALRPSLFGRRWLCLPLTFQTFPSFSPVTASPSLLYLWVDNAVAKSLVLCNPPHHRFPPPLPLGFAWSRHRTVLADPDGPVLILTKFAALAYAPGADRWLKFSLDLPSNPQSPILMGGTIYTLCDVGTSRRSEWKLFSCRLTPELRGWSPRERHGWPRILESLKRRCQVRRLSELGGWAPIEGHRWGGIFEILKGPRLLAGSGDGQILMIGELRTSSAILAPCSTVLILRLDLATLEWDDAGRMPLDMYQSFNGGTLRVFGGDGRVWFSGRRVRGKLAMWEEDAIHAWRWVDRVPGQNEGAYRGFVLNAGLTDMP